MSDFDEFERQLSENKQGMRTSGTPHTEIKDECISLQSPLSVQRKMDVSIYWTVLARLLALSREPVASRCSDNVAAMAVTAAS